MKKYMVIAAAVMVLAWSGGCKSSVNEGDGTFVPESPQSSDEKADEVLVFENLRMVREELLRQCQEYGALVEHYAESASFGPGDYERAKELTNLLSGHYEVAGRRDADGREYYVAVRRRDAPEYDDFQSLSVGYVYGPDMPGEVCRIGYDRENGEETVLYQLPEYSLTVWGDLESAGALDCFCLIPSGASGGREFRNAFEAGGRMELDFLKKHPGLSFFYEDQSYISCYYQDEDTIEFYSEPYICNMLLNEEEVCKLENLLEEGEEKRKEFDNERQAVEWLRQQEPSIRTTGAELKLGDGRYRLLGSKDCVGYMIAYGPKSVFVESCEPVYSYVMDRIKKVMGRDYTSFDDTWFDRPLIKASLEFPRLEQGEDGTYEFHAGSQTVTEPQKLEKLEILLGNAIRGHEAISACPYKGILNLVREDGETLQMFIAADSCDSITYEGRIGFEYGRQEDMAEIFDEAMK